MRLPEPRFSQAFGAILLAAFALRVAARAAGGAHGFWTNSYFRFFQLAQSLANGHGYALPGQPPTAYRVPLYPMFITVVTQGRADFVALVLAQALVSTGTVACVGLLARIWFDRPTALVAAAIAALYPYYLWHDTALQETGLFTFLAAAAMLALVVAQRGRGVRAALAAGLLLGLAILTRATLLPFALCALVWLILPVSPLAPLRARVLSAGLCAAALLGALSPWLAYSRHVAGRASLGTEFGAAVFGGNNDATFAYYPRESIDKSRSVAFRSLSAADRADLAPVISDEALRSDWFLRQGLAWIAANPARFVLGAVRKNLAAFGVMPSPAHDLKTDLVAASSYGPILLLGLIGLWRTRPRWAELLPVYAQFACFAVITGVLWGHSSHRAYLDVYLMVFAASVLVSLAPRLATRIPFRRTMPVP